MTHIIGLPTGKIYHNPLKTFDMKTIYKYELEIQDTQVITMPMNSKILSVQKQGLSVWLWAIVDTQFSNTYYTFNIVGTGNPMPDEPIGDYIGTIQVNGFVWHVFNI